MKLDIAPGSEQWFGFAKIMLRKLKVNLNNMGVDFGRKVFATPDGNGQIIIQTRRNGADWYDSIRIEGGLVTLAMDSGVVELYANSLADPNIFVPGPLYESLGVRVYNLPFVSAVPGWRKNPAKANTGQLSGEVDISSKQVPGWIGGMPINIKGRVPLDIHPAESFHPGTIVDTSVTPSGAKDDPEDAELALKKFCAASCPASIFTGKTRLYVQAIYGEPMNTKNKMDKDGYIIASGNATPSVSIAPGIGGTPSLLLPAYKRTTDTVTYDALELTTGTGVFLDPVTGRHWLFTATATDVVVCALIASKAGERMRKFLVTLPPPANTLNDLDREHLEAYVLSTCRPDVKNVSFLPFGVSLNTWSLGYSWHWNWTGLVADIVTNETFSQGVIGGAPCEAMRSTHRRITMTPTQVPPLLDSNGMTVAPATTTFGATVSIVEGPSDWAVDRVLWCIAEPDWGNGDLTKTTPKFTNLFACDAPFYAFYIRDALKVCRVNVAAFAGPGVTRVTSDGFGAANQMYTTGTQGGFGEDTYVAPAYWGATFTCDGTVLSNLFAYRATNGTRDDISGKSISSTTAPTFTTYESVNYVDIESGYPDPSTGLYTVTRYDRYDPGTSPGTYPYGIVKNTNLVPTFIYTYIHSSTSTQWRGGAIIAIPFMDSEAVFMQDSPSMVVSKTGQQSHACSATVFGRGSSWYSAYYSGYVFMATAWADTVYRYMPGLGSQPIDGTITYPPDEVVTTLLENQSVLICHAGTVPADLTHGNFSRYNNFVYEDVGDDLKTYSGTSVISPVVYSPTRIAPVGIDFAPVVPALVGWV